MRRRTGRSFAFGSKARTKTGRPSSVSRPRSVKWYLAATSSLNSMSSSSFFFGCGGFFFSLASAARNFRSRFCSSFSSLAESGWPSLRTARA